MPKFRTAFNGYARRRRRAQVRFSPFHENRLAVATAQNFGIVGNGRQYILELTPAGIVAVGAFDTADGLYDCAWSEASVSSPAPRRQPSDTSQLLLRFLCTSLAVPNASVVAAPGSWAQENENILVSASGDGSIKVLPSPMAAATFCSWGGAMTAGLALPLAASQVWDVALPPTANPIRSFEEHGHEVYSVEWNTARKDSFLSASWDDTIKLWTLDSPRALRTFAEHSYCVYAAVWNPAHADVFASASGDHTLRVWDVREPRATLVVPAHPQEVLAADWSKYDECMVLTGSVDKTVRAWDVRRVGAPLAELRGHGYAVRRVRCCPHAAGLVASASYDMTVAVWDWRAPEDALLARYDHHTEFAVGLDWSILVEGLLASAAWDENVYVWQHGTDPRTA
eukprot:SM000103S09498  [mRNA]  locus=s103:311070:313114:+ [translate_table: standard]